MEQTMRGFLQILRIGSTMLGLFALTACAAITQQNTRGYVETVPIGKQLVVGETGKDDVRRLLGSPSTVSAFPPETWYYITRKEETVAFLAPEVVEQKIARIEFDAAGKVAKVDAFDKGQMREIAYSNRKTPTEGRTLGLMEQLLGNLGKFNTPKDATQNRE